MQHTTSKVKTTSGLEIFYEEWLPDDPKAVVVLVHGLGEHCGRYAHVAAAFNQAGYALLTMDLPGHGQTGGTRGHIPSTGMVMELIHQRLEEAHRRFPQLPRFLYGHSMGGNLVLYFTLNRKPKIEGIIVTSPGLGTGEPVPAWKMALGNALYNLAPSALMANGLDREGLSHDRAVIDRYISDPLVHDRISARLGMDLIRNGIWIIENAAAFPPLLPILLMQGSADHVVSPQKTQQLATGLAEKKLTYRVWDGYFHELHNEPQKDQVIRTMIDWMDAIVKS